MYMWIHSRNQIDEATMTDLSNERVRVSKIYDRMVHKSPICFQLVHITAEKHWLHNPLSRVNIFGFSFIFDKM